jgi:hypothetical protein
MSYRVFLKISYFKVKQKIVFSKFKLRKTGNKNPKIQVFLHH